MRLARKEKGREGKGREGKGREGKANADYGANRAGKAVGKRSWGEETLGAVSK